MSNWMMMGLQINADKKTKQITVEFPYGEGIAAEFTMPPEQAMDFAKGLMMACFSVGHVPVEVEVLQ